MFAQHNGVSGLMLLGRVREIGASLTELQNYVACTAPGIPTCAPEMFFETEAIAILEEAIKRQWLVDVKGCAVLRDDLREPARRILHLSRRFGLNHFSPPSSYASIQHIKEAIETQRFATGFAKRSLEKQSES